MKKFWNWKSRKIRDQASGGEVAERVLFLNGTIAEESVKQHIEANLNNR